VRKCSGCSLPSTIKAGEAGLLPTHPFKVDRPYQCRRIHCIKVVLLPAMHTQRTMSHRNKDFATALQATCGFNSMEAPTSQGGRGGDRSGGSVSNSRGRDSSWDVGNLDGRTSAASLARRTPPQELLDWGPHLRVKHSSDDFAKWLTSGATVPNVVLFAPVLVSAMSLQ